MFLFFIFTGALFVQSRNFSNIKNHLSLGNKYLEHGNYQEAIIAFQNVIEIQPKNIDARIGLSKVYIKVGKPKEAERVLKEVLEIDPKRVEAYVELSKLYIAQDRIKEATELLEQGFEKTNSEEIKKLLIEIKTGSDKPNEAIKEIIIDPSQFDKEKSLWNEWINYEPNPGTQYGGKFTHAFGGKFGQFTYRFQLPNINNYIEVSITAQLSSDFPMYSGPKDGFSDVNLILNGHEYPFQRVISDDGHGKIYTWKVDIAHLKQGENILSFAIEESSQYKNGLCIYYKSKVAGEEDEPIRVKLGLKPDEKK